MHDEEDDKSLDDMGPLAPQEEEMVVAEVNGAANANSKEGASKAKQELPQQQQQQQQQWGHASSISIGDVDNVADNLSPLPALKKSVATKSPKEVVIEQAVEQLSQSFREILLQSTSLPLDTGDDTTPDAARRNSNLNSRRTSVQLLDLMSSIRHTFSANSHDSLLQFYGDDGQDISDWEEGLAVIDSVLLPGGAAREALSEAQVEGLRKVQQLLWGSFRDDNHKKAHIPKELLKDEPEPGSTSDYILSTYAGVRRVKAKQRVLNVINASRFINRLQIKTSSSRRMKVRDKEAYILPEWSRLDAAQQIKLATLLNWEHLQKWDYDMFEIDQLTNGQPLLFVGWAILASPYSQYVMEQQVRKLQQQQQQANPDGGVDATTVATPPTVSTDSLDDMLGYGYVDVFKVPQDCLVNFLRTVEKDYVSTNPYHNNIHAADVLQTLHAILWGMNGKELAGGELELFSLLLAAVIHDMGHPGKNNSFQVNSRSDLAIQYNDKSVLENMHASLAFRHLLGTSKDMSMNIFQGMVREQVTAARKMIIESVLDTDMTHHFSSVNKIKGIRLSQKEVTRLSLSGNRDQPMKFDSEDAWQILHFILHLSDISNPAKPLETSLKWTDRCLEEFFQQGDEEKRLGLPVSPLCDRMTTQRADSQIGFIKFVVHPAFEVLGKIVPGVQDQVLPILEQNLAFWKAQKEKDESTRLEESQRSSFSDSNDVAKKTGVQDQVLPILGQKLAFWKAQAQKGKDESARLEESERSSLSDAKDVAKKLDSPKPE